MQKVSIYFWEKKYPELIGYSGSRAPIVVRFPDNEEQRRLQSRQSRYAAVRLVRFVWRYRSVTTSRFSLRYGAWLRATSLPTQKFDRLIYRVSDRLLAPAIISIFFFF